jgi:hypothetical protein
LEDDGPGALPLVVFLIVLVASLLAVGSVIRPAVWARQAMLVLWTFSAVACLAYYLAARRGSLFGSLIASYRLPARLRAEHGSPPSVDVRGTPRPIGIERLVGRAYPDIKVSIDLSDELDRGFFLRAGRGGLGSPSFDADATADGPAALVYGLLGLPLRNRLRRLALDGFEIADGSVRFNVRGQELHRVPERIRALKDVATVLSSRLSKLEQELASTALTDPASRVRIGAAHALWALEPDSSRSKKVRAAFASSEDPALLAALHTDQARQAGIEGGELAIAGVDGGLALAAEGELSEAPS